MRSSEVISSCRVINFNFFFSLLLLNNFYLLLAIDKFLLFEKGHFMLAIPVRPAVVDRFELTLPREFSLISTLWSPLCCTGPGCCCLCFSDFSGFYRPSR